MFRVPGQQRGYAQLEVARLDADADAEMAAPDRRGDLCGEGVGDQLNVCDAVGPEMSTRSQRAQKAR